MTQTFAADANNDLSLGPDGNLTLLSGVAAVEAACANAAKTLLGEMVLATDQGLEYFQALWIGSTDVAHFETSLREAILAVDGVTQISSLVFTQTGDTLSYAALIVTRFGPGAVNG